MAFPKGENPAPAKPYSARLTHRRIFSFDQDELTAAVKLVAAEAMEGDRRFIVGMGEMERRAMVWGFLLGRHT